MCSHLVAFFASHSIRERAEHYVFPDVRNAISSSVESRHFIQASFILPVNTSRSIERNEGSQVLEVANISVIFLPKLCDKAGLAAVARAP